MKNIAIFYITNNARNIAYKIYNNIDCDIYDKDALKDIHKYFYDYKTLVFIMATGIVVRKISSLIKSKETDPAVIVCDELGNFVISLLSGHIGGANEMTKIISNIVNGIPVITTSTDLNNKIAFDVFAKKNNILIKNIENMKYISSDIINNKNIGLFSEIDILGKIPNYILKNKYCDSNVFITSKKNIFNLNKRRDVILIPQQYIIGIGCKKNTSFENIKFAVYNFLDKRDIDILSIKLFVSIDLKKNEKGLIDFCNSINKNLITYSSEELKNIEGNFSDSEFVLNVTGVSNVCERSIICYNKNTSIIVNKTVYSGITLALGKLDIIYKI